MPATDENDEQNNQTFSSIPQVPALPFLGSSAQIDKETPINSFVSFAKQYGEIFTTVIPGGKVVVHIASVAMNQQVSNDLKFHKSLSRPLFEVRNLTGDGLFTAFQHEEQWGVAHRVLMPAFGPANIRTMFEGMQDICSQMILKWERFGPSHTFDPSDDYTRLTFDTIALCAMSHRFNSFYTPDLPPFVQQMGDFLSESMARSYRPALLKALPLVYKNINDKYEKDIKDMTELAREIIRSRRANYSSTRDLLSLMLEGRDPKTGKQLSEENIIYNLLTFLIAGHETTSGLLTFATYYLLKNPTALASLRAELDSILGPDPDAEVTLDHLSKMHYLNAVMRETLRLSPTAPARTVVPLEDVVLTGTSPRNGSSAPRKYKIEKDTVIAIHFPAVQRDPAVYGSDAEEFRPERMMDEKFEKLPQGAWTPFGYGMRACIGRPFAWQEAQLVLARVFHSFDVYFVDPGYALRLKQALTIKPKDMRVRVVPRPKPSHSTVHKSIALKTKSVERNVACEDEEVTKIPPKASQPLYVYYGSNTGTCESLAQRIVSDAHEHGFSPRLATLDEAASRLPTDGPVVIATASFEGEPADNAAQFVAWLQNASAVNTETSMAGPLSEISYAVFGCGNREWTRTFQRIPTIIDDKLEAAGAERLLERGQGDAASPSFFQAFELWEASLWPILQKRYSVSSHKEGRERSETLRVEIVEEGSTRAKLLRQPEARASKVLENRILTHEDGPQKRHIEIALPDGMEYRAGDYLAVLPVNPQETVKRVLSRFRLSPEQEVVIKAEGPTTFPVNSPIAVSQLLSGYIEMSQPATSRDINDLLRHAQTSETKSALERMRDRYSEEVLEKRMSVLDILEDYQEINLSLASFLRMMPPMRVRQYSISSSPLADPTRVSLTVSVLSAPSLSGTNSRRFLGVASNFLASLKPGNAVPAIVRPSNGAFHLPADPHVPLVLFAAGSGLAPFRGFVQERAAQKRARMSSGTSESQVQSQDVGPIVLFFGCRSPDEDFLYFAEYESQSSKQDSEDLKRWRDEGVVDVRPAFSRKPEASEGCKYVQHRIWHDREDIIRLFNEGAKFYTCGSRKAATGIKDTCVEIIKTTNRNWSDDDARKAFEKLQGERYATDVFD